MGFSVQGKNTRVWSPGLRSATDVLCDLRQVTSPPWASSSPLHTREVIFRPSLCQGHEGG